MERSKENREKEREKKNRRYRRFYGLIAPPVDRIFSSRLAYTYDRISDTNVKGPVVVCFDHCCAYDPIFVGVALRDRLLAFIASEHILRARPWNRFLRRYPAVIPHSKGARSNRTALTAIKRLRRGDSIFLAHEGEQTWDGISGKITPFTGKLVKAGNATLVTYRIEGAYLAKPRWSLSDRKGEVSGHIVGIYGPAELADMSESEIEEIIERDTHFDVWEWQRSRPGGPVSFKPKKGGAADGLERAVFTCPSCGGIGTLKSSGDGVNCCCGWKIRMADTGFFEQPAPFETVADWMERDRARLREILKAAAGQGPDAVVFGGDAITLIRINDDHTDEVIAGGILSLRYTGGEVALRAAGHEFKIRDIYDMKMVLAGKILFSDKSGYYEIRSGKKSRTNLYKYLAAREILTETGDLNGLLGSES